MDQVHDSVDKLAEEVHWLERLLDVDDEHMDATRVELALSVAKRVRAKSTLTVRALANERDHPSLQP